MHGRVKTRSTAEQNEIKRQEREQKVKSYQTAMKFILSKRLAGIHDNEVIDVTANLLAANPDIITLWNYRREILLEMKKDLDEESYQKLLEKDLPFTEQCLRVNPKSYGSWHHRVWILDNLPKPDWEKEVRICTKYLNLDERNFLCWNYRKTVTERANISDLSEYEYTLEKIKTNFSNYSAWHLRSKLLPVIFPDNENQLPITESKHKEELELVQNAAFTDPNDQSAWFYQRWLLGLIEPKAHFVAVQSCGHTIFVAVSKTVKQLDEFKLGAIVNVKINDKIPKGFWKSSNDHLHSSVWVFHCESNIDAQDIITLTLCCKDEELDRVEVTGTASLIRKSNFMGSFSEALNEVLREELSSCMQLLELEPDSKWTLLTSILLMQSIDCMAFKKDIMSCLKKLIEIDRHRRGYYADLYSKLSIEFAMIFHDIKHSATSEFRIATPAETQKINLSEKKVTCLYHTQYLMLFEEVNLSHNHLKSETLANLHCLQNCRTLNLSNNKITNLKHFPVLPKLKILSLSDNLIETEEDIHYLEKCTNLEKVCLKNNPVAENAETWKSIQQRFSLINLNDPEKK